jgi:hypothetical protein
MHRLWLPKRFARLDLATTNGAIWYQNCPLGRVGFCVLAKILAKKPAGRWPHGAALISVYPQIHCPVRHQ